MQINVYENNFKLDLGDLITVGIRSNNKKRNFLFISKVLGKHLEVKPNICKVIGRILVAAKYREGIAIELLKEYLSSTKNEILVENEINKPISIDEKVFILGFAETATGLGMSVAATIKDSYYQTTTRECVKNVDNMISFEEEHSHATSHKCYALDKNKIKNVDRIILVDDEITTGKSMLNLISELIKITPVKKYTILSILDWRNDFSKEEYNKFKKKYNVDIEVISLISGDILDIDDTVYFDTSEVEEISETCEPLKIECLDKINLDTDRGCIDYLLHSGRFGTSHKEILNLESKCQSVADKINEFIGEKEKVLVVGHGENIYIPSRIASYIDGEVMFRSTTRSPIYCKNEKSYPIRDKSSFVDRGVKYFFYNKVDAEKGYDKIIFITETDLNIKLTKNTIVVRL